MATITITPRGPFSLAASGRFLEGFAPARYIPGLALQPHHGHRFHRGAGRSHREHRVPGPVQLRPGIVAHAAVHGDPLAQRRQGREAAEIRSRSGYLWCGRRVTPSDAARILSFTAGT